MRSHTFLIAAALVTVAPAAATAGLYSPDEPLPFDIKDNGEAEALPYSTFRLLLMDLAALDILDSPEREQLVQRAAQRRAKGLSSLTVEEIAGFTHDLMRLGRPDERPLLEAVEVLYPLTRDRTKAGFLPLPPLARTLIARGQWDEAYDQQESALRDYPFPTSFGKYTPAQLAWCRRVERDYYLPLLRARRDEARQKRTRVQETVDALFPPLKKGERRENRQPV